MVMVQEDQATGLGHIHQGLYTKEEGFEASPESIVNPNTWILGMSQYCNTQLGICLDLGGVPWSLR